MTQTAYLLAANEHLNNCEADLRTIKSLLDTRPLGRLEQHAAERSLQLLIEAAIGLAKHWAKKEAGYSNSDAYNAFQILADKGHISSSQNWRKTIGLRNVLVHDYLNVDPQIVQDVIAKEYFNDILSFGRQAIKALEK